MGLLSRDTDPAAEEFQLTILRSLSPSARAACIREMILSCHQLTLAGVRLRQPHLAAPELASQVRDIWLGRPLVGGDRAAWQEGGAMEPFEITGQVVEVLEDLGLPYLIGGSLASGVHGEPRATRDADLVVQISLSECDRLAASLEAKDFYVSLPAMQEAVRRRGSFNVIHPAFGFKVDLFVSPGRDFERSRFARRQPLTVGERTFLISSAEDTLVAKLEWFRAGHEVSDQQWRDVLGILALQGAELDMEYLKHWALELGVADLLERALNAPR